MISDSDLYSLAIFLGCLSMLLIVLYHFLEVNAAPDDSSSDMKGSDTSATYAYAAKAGPGNVSGDVVNPSAAGQSVAGADVVAAVGVNGVGKRG